MLTRKLVIAFGVSIASALWGCDQKETTRSSPPPKSSDAGQQSAADKHKARPPRTQIGDVVPGEISNSIGMTLVPIPEGKFQMGSPESDKDAQPDEMPKHEVQITKKFYLGKCEVTQGEWFEVMETEPWKGREYVKEGDDYPATYVNWNEAGEFCKKLGLKEGKTYRLPTEAEWEYACRGGKTGKYHFGDDDKDLGNYAWYGAFDNGNTKDERYPHPVGKKRANPFGLHDMHGNTWEWCSDWYGMKFYSTSPKQDPQGPDSKADRQHKSDAQVIRGGGWYDRAMVCRAAIRFGYPATNRLSFLGFRVVQVRQP